MSRTKIALICIGIAIVTVVVLLLLISTPTGREILRRVMDWSVIGPIMPFPLY